MPLSAIQTIESLHHALRDYIEATYHISNPALIEQRRQLLDAVGVIYQRPFIESTPRYQAGDSFSNMDGLHDAVRTMFSRVSGSDPVLVHDPPYHHQYEAVQKTLVERRSLVVMTGTGSGKTETFLLPILGKLAHEAGEQPDSFRSTAGVRALVLYPMNALVNDQLGRLRLLFGDPRVVEQFVGSGGRPARFARYTSRTLYPGVRTARRDQVRLKPIRDFYVEKLRSASDPSAEDHEAARILVSELQARGKWPAKHDLVAWYGEDGARWMDHRSGEYRRCVMHATDPELLTRHEVHSNPPDILVTNYCMLEYMLMRPLERPIFEATRRWLAGNPNETFLLVVDEAHLYRGAQGAEVALLLRRLRSRLGISPQRLQVICTSASFDDPAYASEFGAGLSGKSIDDFDTVTGRLHLRPNAGQALGADLEALINLDLGALYDAETNEERLEVVRSFLDYRSVDAAAPLGAVLHTALRGYPPMSLLVNSTMQRASPLDGLPRTVFGGEPSPPKDMATTTLMALGSLARSAPDEPPLLPCRIHAFFRGLPGLWICMDPDCTAIPAHQRDGPGGKLFAQPRDICECGARVLEYYTCRNCGTSYACAYTNDVQSPTYLWPEPGQSVETPTGWADELQRVDILLEQPTAAEAAEPAHYDLETGRLNPERLGPRCRIVYLPVNRDVGPDAGDGTDTQASQHPGQFRPCAVCGQHGDFGRSAVQDHQTKGDEPFQVLVARQIQVQPPGPQRETRLAPLRGRKVLTFSDSRQTAARLAPNLQRYSTQDVLRPLIVSGFHRLQNQASVQDILSLQDLYLAVLVAASLHGVRLRPELKPVESFEVDTRVDNGVQGGVLERPQELLRLLISVRSIRPPESLLRGIYRCFSSPYYGLTPLGLASVIEAPQHSEGITALPDIPGIAETPEAKAALVHLWLRFWRRSGFWLDGHCPDEWWMNRIRSHRGIFRGFASFLPDTAASRLFRQRWLPQLLEWFTESPGAGGNRLRGTELSLAVGGPWCYCQTCRSVQRPFPGTQRCVECGRPTAETIDPDTDPVFTARKGYYRASSTNALQDPPIQLFTLIAAEHTAQLNTAQADEVFSRAEEYELLFQDIMLDPPGSRRMRPAVDVLSCTTTMEVGIDIGSLSGVSLRNMPPARSNYQQRSGRAGRRGNSVATVTAYASADSHDNHYFSNPDDVIRGQIEDPTLTLDNYEITRRHLTAYLLQRYHQDRLPNIRPEDQPQLFAVLGSVANFRRPENALNRHDLGSWLEENAERLQAEVEEWLPAALSEADRESLLAGIATETMRLIDTAIDFRDEAPPPQEAAPAEQAGPPDDAARETVVEGPPEQGVESPDSGANQENLLDRLLYNAVLPRFAFPTDVAAFYVFDDANSTRFRPAFSYTPSQGLGIALSQYAPGKEIWIDGKLYTSGAIYSPIAEDRSRAWVTKRLYLECSECGYALTEDVTRAERGETRDCTACGGTGTLGPAQYWLRPPGFAHRHWEPPDTSVDDEPAMSRATRAKLSAPSPIDQEWMSLGERIRIHASKRHLMVTNRGPRDEGYTYCTICGLIEPATVRDSLVGTDHRKPYPDDREPNCPSNRVSRGLVIGADFPTDVLLISLRVQRPVLLSPRFLATHVALRTLTEALIKAASLELELEPGEIEGEYRPALTPEGRTGTEVEIYLYDTLPGGAGFVRRTGEIMPRVLGRVESILGGCDCERSCYHCLRSYKNKFEHDKLDRHIAAALLSYIETGSLPLLSDARLQRAAQLLCADLIRQDIPGVSFARNQEVEVPGVGRVTAPILVNQSRQPDAVLYVSSPLVPNVPSAPELAELAETSLSTRVLALDELLVRSNLPMATQHVVETLALRNAGS